LSVGFRFDAQSRKSLKNRYFAEGEWVQTHPAGNRNCCQDEAHAAAYPRPRFAHNKRGDSMKMKTRLALVALAAVGFTACGGGGGDDTTPAPADTRTRLVGVAATGAPLAGAAIKVCDATGASVSTTAAADGSYSVDVSTLTAPLLVAATTAAFVPINDVPQPANGTVAYAALLPAVAASAANTANVNQLSDKIASDVAVTDLALKGSVQLINACNTTGVTSATIASRTASLRNLLLAALTAEGVADAAAFDPVTTPMVANHQGVDAVLDRVRHNRDGWGSGTDDQLRGTKLYDYNMREISSSNVALDPTLAPWSTATTRIFVVGDSTASNYTASVAPRKGWGQVFDRSLKADAPARVVNLAQSGRSSRSFITEGWFKVLADNLQAGDYVLIQWGHNDEKCDTTGSLDWVNRCTYPNNASGQIQLPTTLDKLTAGTTAEDLSFQRSLEKYIALARSRGATPVLITPVTRINQDRTVTAYIEGAFPITRSTHITTRGDGPGNYSQTVIDTATANNVALIDVDAASIAFYNTLGVGTGGATATGGWRDYYLSVSDAVTYPFYATASTTGHYLNADRTHSQETGALKIAEWVANGVKADAARLSGLSALLN
jgi:lysophospholipase L1-like esterase